MVNALTGFPVIREGCVRLAPLAALPAVAADRGVSMSGLLESVGLAPDLFEDLENTATMADIGRLLAASAAALGCEHVALDLARRITLNTLGPIGALSRQAPNVGAALRGLILALHLHDRVTVPTLNFVEGRAALGAVPIGPATVGAAYIADLTTAACAAIVQGLCGTGWRPQEVHLARRRPRDPRPWAALFRVPPKFDAETNRVIFDAAWLKHPVAADGTAVGADPFGSILSLHPLDPPARVRRFCVTAIMEGNPTVQRVARLGGVSRRTLNRQLATFGTTAQAELIRVKLAIARQLLEGTDLSLTEIAHLLGYADGSAFTRAFRSAEGISPSQWRGGRVSVL